MYNVVESGTGRGCCAGQTCFYICPDLISSMFSKLDQCSRCRKTRSNIPATSHPPAPPPLSPPSPPIRDKKAELGFWLVEPPPQAALTLERLHNDVVLVWNIAGLCSRGWEFCSYIKTFCLKWFIMKNIFLRLGTNTDTTKLEEKPKWEH